MVVFQQDTIRQVVSVVMSAPDSYCIFFKYTAVWCCFSCIKKCHITSFKKLCHLSGVSCNATHSLQIVQGNTLSGKKYADISGYSGHQLTFFYFISVLAMKINFCLFIKDRKYSRVDFQSGNHSIFFCDQVNGSLCGSRHYCICRNILACDIFL